MLALLAMSVRILREYERGVVFTLGRFTAVKGPGLIFLVPYLQQMVRVDLRTAVFDVPKGHPASAILSDNGLDDTGEMILRRVRLEGLDPGELSELAGHRVRARPGGVCPAHGESLARRGQPAGQGSGHVGPGVTGAEDDDAMLHAT